MNSKQRKAMFAKGKYERAFDNYMVGANSPEAKKVLHLATSEEDFMRRIAIAKQRSNNPRFHQSDTPQDIKNLKKGRIFEYPKSIVSGKEFNKNVRNITQIVAPDNYKVVTEDTPISRRLKVVKK